MKIVYVITRSDVMGGASIHLLDLAEGVQARGHDVTILVGGDGIVVDRAREKGLTCISLKYLVREISPLKDVRGYFEIKRRLSELSPDLVHLHSAKAGILGRLAAASQNVPSVYTAHGWAFTEGVSERNRRLYSFIEKRMAGFSSRIITVSNYDRSLALDIGVGSYDLLTTIHNGIPDLPGCLPSHDVALSTSPVRLIMIARFEEPKDHELLIKGLADLADLDWEVELVGDGPNLEAIKDLVNRSGLGHKIDFLGARNDVPERLRSADVLVLTSRWEGLPLTILEGMRTGLPVVASDVGGVSESVAHGQTGYLVPRGELDPLVDALRRIIESPEKRQAFGQAGRKKYEEEFTFEHMLESTITVYDGVLRVRQ